MRRFFSGQLQRQEMERLDVLFAGEMRLFNERVALDLLERKMQLDERKARVLAKLAGRLPTS